MRRFNLILSIVFILSCNSEPDSLTLTEELGYKKEDILLIVHADDFGMFPGQTDGTIEALKFGMVKSTSIMAPCPDFDRAIEYLKSNPQVDGGIHLTLNNEWQEGYPWCPVLSREIVPSLYNDNGLMHAREHNFAEKANLKEAKLELEAQILKVLETGYKPSHLDFHMGTVYENPELQDAIIDLSLKYKIPMMAGFWFPSMYLRFLEEDFIMLNYMRCIYETNRNRKEVYKEALTYLGPGVNVLLIHPAYTEGLDDWLEMPYIRSEDLEIWTDPEIKEHADELGIKFIDYKDIRDLQLKRWK